MIKRHYIFYTDKIKNYIGACILYEMLIKCFILVGWLVITRIDNMNIIYFPGEFFVIISPSDNSPNIRLPERVNQTLNISFASINDECIGFHVLINRVILLNQQGQIVILIFHLCLLLVFHTHPICELKMSD